MTKAQILEQIRQKVQSENVNPAWEDLKLDNIDYDVEEQVGGEGEGDYYYVILKVRPIGSGQSMFVQVTASYTSYDGTDFSYGDVSEVEPYEKTVRDWREVK